MWEIWEENKNRAGKPNFYQNDGKKLFERNGTDGEKDDFKWK